MDHVAELKSLLFRDRDIDVKSGAVEKLIEMLLLREKEMAEPCPPRGTIDYYFWPPDSSKETRDALYEALPELLFAWVHKKQQEKE